MKMSGAMIMVVAAALSATALQAQTTSTQAGIQTSTSPYGQKTPERRQINKATNRGMKNHRATRQMDGKSRSGINYQKNDYRDDNYQNGRRNRSRTGSNGYRSNRMRNNANNWRNNAHSNSRHVQRCKARYHTYNPRTDMFYARPGVKQHCKL